MSIPKIAPYSVSPALLKTTHRVGWKPDKDRTVLLIHDMQDFFLDKFDITKEPIISLVNNITTLVAQCRAFGIPIFYTAQPVEQSKLDRALLNDFWGAGLTEAKNRGNILAKITPQDGDIVLAKWRYSAFQRTSLLEQMIDTHRDQIMICGVYAHIGCLITAIDAFMRDIQPFLISDAVADFSPADHIMAINYAANSCGVSLSTSEALDLIQSR